MVQLGNRAGETLRPPSKGSTYLYVLKLPSGKILAKLHYISINFITTVYITLLYITLLYITLLYSTLFYRHIGRLFAFVDKKSLPPETPRRHWGDQTKKASTPSPKFFAMRIGIFARGQSANSKFRRIRRIGIWKWKWKFFAMPKFSWIRPLSEASEFQQYKANFLRTRGRDEPLGPMRIPKSFNDDGNEVKKTFPFPLLGH